MLINGEADLVFNFRMSGKTVNATKLSKDKDTYKNGSYFGKSYAYTPEKDLIPRSDLRHGAVRYIHAYPDDPTHHADP